MRGVDKVRRGSKTDDGQLEKKRTSNGSRNPDNGEARRGGDRRGVFLGVRLVASNSYNVRNVNSSGAMNWNNAYNGNRGVRPLWWNTANE